jgi:hypothetical protein
MGSLRQADSLLTLGGEKYNLAQILAIHNTDIILRKYAQEMRYSEFCTTCSDC